MLTPTSSAAGTTQVVARVLEVALHKTHELGFRLDHVVDGVATAPLPAPSPDGVEAMGRTNDAILYGGRVHLSCAAATRRRARSRQLPSRNSEGLRALLRRDLQGGRVRLLQDRPGAVRARPVWVSNLDSGSSFHGGALNMGLLRGLWLKEACRRRIAIATDEVGWHTRQLQAALRERGAVGRCVDLEDCRIDTGASWHGLVIPGFGAAARCGAGARHRRRHLRTGDQAARRAACAARTGRAGLQRRARHRAQRRQSMTSLLLHAAGVPRPPTWAMESPRRRSAW